MSTPNPNMTVFLLLCIVGLVAMIAAGHYVIATIIGLALSAGLDSGPEHFDPKP